MDSSSSPSSAAHNGGAAAGSPPVRRAAASSAPARSAPGGAHPVAVQQVTASQGSLTGAAGGASGQASTSASSSPSSAQLPAAANTSEATEVKGWLYKWTNYVRGYQKRWFVLSNGLLSYYRSQGEMAYHSRASIALNGASIQVEGGNNFIISNGGGTQTFHLRAVNESDKQRWIQALELSKARSMRNVAASGGGEGETDDDGFESSDNDNPQEISKQELATTVKALTAKMEDLSTCSDLVGRHGAALVQSLNALKLEKMMEYAPPEERAVIKNHIKTVNERSALLKLTSGAMVKAASDFLQTCKHDGKRWTRLLENERELRQKFEDMVEQYAQQHSNLEAQMRHEYHLRDPSSLSTSADGATALPDGVGAEGKAAAVLPAPLAASSPDKLASPKAEAAADAFSGSDDDDDFHDAVTDPEEVFTISAPPCYSSHPDLSSKRSETSSKEDEVSDEDGDISTGNQIKIVKKSKDGEDTTPTEGPHMDWGQRSPSGRVVKRRRSKVTDRPNLSISLWGILKNSIGKDLTRIPVPVNFSEPLSMLQRLTEDFEYSDILFQAANVDDDCEQMAYVAAFTVSAYCTTAIRSNKPFNPLLGETFECDRSDDKGWKLISEQVSHHPPMLAQYCESTDGARPWKCWQEFSMRSKFKGKYLEIEPVGITHLVFPKSGNHYTWRKVKTVVHNIVIGKLWVDQHGEMSVINHAKDIKCHMKFDPYSYFGGTPKKVTGSVVNAQEKVEWVLNGTWDSKFDASKVINESIVKGKTSLEIGSTKTLWAMQPPDPGAEKYYNFSRLACQLNEPEPGVAPTDSRLRPDQRMMEDGDWDGANREKVRLEEKQRAVRKIREEAAQRAIQEGRSPEPYQPTWFTRKPDQENGGKLTFVYHGGYWEAKDKQEWVVCPDIY